MSSKLIALLSPDGFTLRFISDLSQIESLLTMMGAILATILGIFFSISIIVVQHAASNYTASLLEEYKKDRRTWFVFFYYWGSLGAIILTLQYRTDSTLINMTIITFFFSFLFLASQFLHIIDLIDPRKIIENAKEESLKDIKHIPFKIEAILKEKKPKNDFEKGLVDSPLVKSKQKILQITDVILKACTRREIETSIIGFKALSEIVRSYVSLRKDDPTQNDDFIQYIYDQLLFIYEIALGNKDTSLLRQIIITFEEIGSSTTDIKSISIFGGPNQITLLAIWHINDLGTKAIDKSYFDVSAQAIFSLKTIGILTIQKSNSDGLASDKILNIGLLGIGQENWFITGYAFNGLKELLLNAVSKRIEIHSEPSEILEDIEKLAQSSIKIGIGYNSLQNSLFPSSPEYSIQMISWMAFQIKNENYPQIETSSREEYSKEVISKLMQTLGNIAIWAAEQDSLLLLGLTVNHILKITLSMLKEKFVTISEGYREEILRIVDDLSKSYMISKTLLLKRGSLSPIPSEISDVIASIAIYALDNQQKEIVIHCEEVLHCICISSIERDIHGYDVARCAGRIGVIGAYALNKRENELSDKALELLVSFDKIYLSKSPNPHDKLHIEVMKSLHQEFSTDYILSKAYGNLFKEVPQKILDDFIALYETKRNLEFTNK